MEKINPFKIPENIFHLIGNDWMLITSGSLANYNMMTASWGTAGVMWGKPVITVVVRPQRYTLEFIDANELFTCSFFGEDKRSVLNLLGSKSGRDIDKMHVDGLTPLAVADEQAIAFKEAKLTLVCRKLFRQSMTLESFTDSSVPASVYPTGDYHVMFTAEITEAFNR